MDLGGAMRIVGLTGGIASGKSTASKEFEALGVPIIDADKVARAASKKGTLAWRRIVLTFGKEILQEDGEINRGRLGEIIFSDHAKRKALNSAMSFSIGIGLYWELFKHWIKGTKVVIMDVPLLFEAKLDRLTKPIIVVWVDPETQEARLVKRDKISKELALKKISSQLSLDEKRDRADIVIDNTSSIEAMKQQVQDIYKEIVATPSTMKELLFSRRGIFFLLATTIFGLWWLKG
ncbi:hypothetical protein KP509_27G055000 [Ceratopteris richardii]|uniref:Dephospho-CoA kinase n=1 Tax=Ceratopteris richardii TaxID=49495 RepID=A0A8T2RJ24_CERRI|nr:hypothetical protein KP509_27G055000 [Ceratopteris richardii]